VNSMLLECPIEQAILPGSRRLTVWALLDRLEAWLPAEEDRLLRARQQDRPLARQEADWHALLELYERLSAAAGKSRQPA
jgi:hypothetical protein